MMKKLVLLATSAIFFACGTHAQDIRQKSIMFNSKEYLNVNPNFFEDNNLNFEPGANVPNSIMNGAKTTGGSRIYNYVDYLYIVNSSVANNDFYPYMWNKPDMYGIYQGTAGLERDTINLASYGFVLQPWFKQFNDAAYPGNPIGVRYTDAYSVDSVYVYGEYGRNPAKPNVVDTLRFAFTYGTQGTYAANNFGNYYYSGETANYGVDTVRFAGMYHDSIGNTLRKGGGTGAVTYKDKLLTAASLSDTTADGSNVFKIPLGVNVPAGNLVGVSVTFKSGDTYTPFSDTAYRGSLNAAVPFKYGMFRPRVYEENAGAYPTYQAGSFAAGTSNYNAGSFKLLPVTNGYNGIYIPTWAFVQASPYEWPDIDFKITCSACKTVQQLAGVENVNSVIASAKAYPNPANDNLQIPVTLSKDASVTVSLMNAVGQIVKSQSLGNMHKGVSATANFSTSDLATGMYIYTVKAGNDQINGKISVVH